MSIKSSDAPDKTKSEQKIETAPSSFDDRDDYFAHLKANSATEVFISVTTKPPTLRDPRADAYHAVIEARVFETVATDKKGKPIREEKHVTFCAALDLLVVDQIAQPKEFDAITEKALSPFLEAAARAGLEVRRGRL